MNHRQLAEKFLTDFHLWWATEGLSICGPDPKREKEHAAKVAWVTAIEAGLEAAIAIVGGEDEK